MSSKDPTDRFLRGVNFAVALVRVLRGESPEKVVADTREMAERARGLRHSIRVQMGEAEPISPRAPSAAEGRDEHG